MVRPAGGCETDQAVAGADENVGLGRYRLPAGGDGGHDGAGGDGEGVEPACGVGQLGVDADLDQLVAAQRGWCGVELLAGVGGGELGGQRALGGVAAGVGDPVGHDLEHVGLGDPADQAFSLRR